MKKFLSITFGLLLTAFASAQNVGISEDNSIPDPSAMLEIKSSERGLLIPRMSTTQRGDISTPANGLLVYDNDTQSFWYFNSVWTELKEGSDDQVLSIVGSTISIENGNSIGLPADQDSQQLSIVGSSISIENGNTILLPPDQDAQQLTLVGNSLSIDNGNAVLLPSSSGLSDVDGDTKIEVDDGLDNDQIALYAGSSLTPVAILTPTRLEFNTASNLRIGDDAGGLYVAGSSNTLVGQGVGSSMSGGSYNTFVGRLAGRDNQGTSNTFMGAQAGESNTTGSSNTLIGDYTAHNINTGQGNTIIGANAGTAIDAGSGNVFIGNNVNATSNVSNKLYIDNSYGDTPLILGDFNANTLQVNGTLNINGQYELPSSLGSAGQVLISDGSGQSYWGAASGGSSQTLSIAGDQLSISGGNTVTIPGSTSPFEVTGTVVRLFSGASSNDFVFGSTAMTNTGISTHDNRFLFDKSKGAFRAGAADDFQWDGSNMGDYSFAAGTNNMASGYCATAFGLDNDANGSLSACFGSNLEVNATTCSAFGRYNVGSGGSTWINSEPLFEIGNGANSSNKKNALTVLKNGKVIIGYEGTDLSSIGAGYDLVVDGPMICEEVRVQDSGSWPDYVFDTEYELMTFAELRAFLEDNNHLPGVPDANTVNGNGYNLGEMNEILLEKIEELHLYMLQLEAQISELQSNK